ncbi:MAG TPA: class I SAM-dependent methyltransferase, partial [Chitinophagaceae bacterium]|nr:class I SAM-dependent methyltransferase [Chitinophagaceae bacterium]
MIGKFKENKKFRKAGKMLLTDPLQIDGQQKSEWEENKKPARTEIINFLLSLLNRETTYLEIGVRNPDDNFNHIKANIKYSVDPGLEFKSNPADFKMTSDDFFEKMEKGEVLSGNIKFDLIFVDGLHLAEQADKDIKNAERYIKEDGFIVVHDCNPPTEWHAREEF